MVNASDPEKLPGLLAFPCGTHGHGVLHPDCFTGACIRAAAAEPAFIGIDHDRGPSGFRIGHHDVAAAGIDADIAADAEFFVKEKSGARSDRI